MIKQYIGLFILLASVLAACNDNANDTTTEEATLPKANYIKQEDQPDTALKQPLQQDLQQEEEQPKKPEASKQDTPGFRTITWEDLEKPGHGAEAIYKRHEKEIDLVRKEGKPADELMKKIQEAIDNAPVNDALDGQKVKIPGFVTPLETDERTGMIDEFLLVPNFGACMHLPPPPINQTLLVNTLPGKSVDLSKTYGPVWVMGTISTDSVKKDIGTAGYQIPDAVVVPYK